MKSRCQDIQTAYVFLLYSTHKYFKVYAVYNVLREASGCLYGHLAPQTIRPGDDSPMPRVLDVCQSWLR